MSLLLRNTSTGEYADDTFRVDQITLTSSCGSKLGIGTCPAGGEDPGVFVPSATGVGRAGTACAGQTFNITLLDPVTGRYLFTPTTPVTLGPVGSPADTCAIDFTVDVARAPTKDSDPAQPGPQTGQYATVSLTDITPGITFGQTGGGTGTDETTVLQAAPQIATAVSDAEITPGDTFTDTATVTGPAGAPTPTGTVTFFVYGPDDATCAGAPVFGSLTRPLTADGTATSGPFTPTASGTYRVIARYSGDANYTTVSGNCNDPNEMVVVTRATPQILTQASPTIELGEGTLTDTATVTGLFNPMTGVGAGTVTFTLYGPDDATCAGAPVFSSLNRPLTLNGAATSGTATSSPPFTPTTAGTYRWIASYTGDANNAPVAGNCGDVNEQTVVLQAPEIAVVKDVAPATRPVPGGQFTFTVQVSNPGPERIRILTLNDNVYGNIANATGPRFTGSTCGALIGTELAPGVLSAPCTFVGTFTSQTPATETDVVTVTGVGVDSGLPVTATDDAIVTVQALLPSIRVEKTADPTSRSEPGGTFTFTFSVTNTGPNPVTITSLVDNVYGDLNGRGTCAVAAVLAAGATYTCTFSGDFFGNAGAAQTDVITVTARDNLGQTVTSQSQATVTINDLPPTIVVTKTPDPISRPAPGGVFRFTVRVTNTSSEEVRITTLFDDIYGDLNGRGSCAVGVVLAPNGGSYSCAFDGEFRGHAGASQTDTVTAIAIDNDGTSVTAIARATVTLTPPGTPPVIQPPPAVSPVVQPPVAIQTPPRELVRTGSELSGLAKIAGLLLLVGMTLIAATRRFE